MRRMPCMVMLLRPPWRCASRHAQQRRNHHAWLA